MTADIILIGPISTGKSTAGTLLAQRLGLPQRSMDDLRWDYYREIGYDEELAKLTVYTENKTPSETCEEILSSIED